jgi:hypothetical protein
VNGRPRGEGAFSCSRMKKRVGGEKKEGRSGAGVAFLYQRAVVADDPVGWRHAVGED